MSFIADFMETSGAGMFGTYGKRWDLVDKKDVRLGDCGDDAWSELDDYLKAWREINI